MGELSVSKPQSMHQLYEKLRRKKMVFRHVCEVGVYRPEAAHFVDFIRQGVRTTLVEANPEAAAALHAAFNAQNVSIHAVAVWDTHGTLTLSNAAASTFATALPSSPALENDHHRIHAGNTFEVPCVPFSTLDDGSIDLLGVDIEGGEWYVLKHLHSRPKVLCIETHGKYYTNPFLAEITQWLHSHGYALWYKDGSDSVYIQRGLFSVSLQDRTTTAFAELSIHWDKFRRRFKRSANVYQHQ